MRRAIFAAATFALATASAHEAPPRPKVAATLDRKEPLEIATLVAMAPNHPDDGVGQLQWARVSANSTRHVRRADQVSLRLATETELKPLGALAYAEPGVNVSASSGVSLTARVFEHRLYSLLDTAGDHGEGCCGNSLEERSPDGSVRYIELDGLVQFALNTSDAFATHTFQIMRLQRGKQSVLAGLFVVTYVEPRLGGGDVEACAVVAIDLRRARVLPTASGSSAFVLLDEIGTFSSDAAETRFKVQYFEETGTSSDEQFHMNGLLRFRSKHGWMLALTHKNNNEALVLRDPFTYPAARGGGRLVQRFGTPASALSGDEKRHFGLAQNETAFTGVHNVHFTPNSPTFGGAETLTIFVNEQDGASKACEFELRPARASAASSSSDDTVFATRYSIATLPFQTDTQGGARVVGKGVYLVSSGSASTTRGLCAVDLSGASHCLQYTLGDATHFYDPFVVWA